MDWGLWDGLSTGAASRFHTGASGKDALGIASLAGAFGAICGGMLGAAVGFITGCIDKCKNGFKNDRRSPLF